MPKPAKKPKMGRPREKPLARAFDRAVGARIRALKKANDLTDQQLADKIGRSVSQVFRYQSGDTSADAQTLAMLGRALGCSVAELVEGIKVGK